MNKLISTLTLFSIALIGGSGCEKDPVPNPDGTFPECIELSGTQSTSLVLTNHVTDPAVPDYCISGTYFIHADVVVEPGVFIQMKDDSKIHVQNNGSFQCVGTATAATGGKIIIKGENGVDSGQWASIHFSSNSTNNQLIYTNISGGGNGTTYDALIYIGHQGYAELDNCYVSSSSSNGIKTESTSSVLGGISSCTISGCGLHPIEVSSRQIAQIAPSIITGGNGMESIEVRPDQLQNPATWNISNVPLHFDGVFSLTSNLTVSPGVQFRFAPNSKIVVYTDGSLNCIGTGTQAGRIRFRGDSETPGSWGGVAFISSTSTLNRFENCDFSYGGGDPSYLGMITLWSSSTAQVGNSSFFHSAEWGIYQFGGMNTYIDNGNNTFGDNNSGDVN